VDQLDQVIVNLAGLENGSEKNLGFFRFFKNLKKPEKSQI